MALAMQKTPEKLDKSLKRELAVKAGVDPRSLEKILAGKLVRGMAGRRARAVLEAAGYLTAPTGAERWP